MTESIGRVLFIDEAYRLKGDLFMEEAADEVCEVPILTVLAD